MGWESFLIASTCQPPTAPALVSRREMNRQTKAPELSPFLVLYSSKAKTEVRLKASSKLKCPSVICRLISNIAVGVGMPPIAI